MTDPTRDSLIARFGLQPLAGATHVTHAQIEQARAETRRRRCERIQAANDAVDTYMRDSGTRNYQAVFSHIQRTRPELFADMQVPAHQIATGNFNPYHDQMGKFTTSDDATSPHGREQRPHLGAQVVRIDAVGQPQAKDTEYHGKISAGAYFQSGATGECSIAIARETVTQIESVRTDSDEPLPKGADSSMRALQYAVQKYWEPASKSFDFSEATIGHGAPIQDVLPILSAKFNIHSQPVTIDQLPEALKHGPVMVVVRYHGTDHGELIIGLDKDRDGRIIPGSYRAYNPLNRIAHETTLDGSDIFMDSKGRPELFALRPYRKGEKHPDDDARPLPAAKGPK